MSGPASVTVDRFIGRTDELRRVMAASAAAARGRGSLTVVSGEAGIGKSRFCQEVISQVRRAGLTATYARCWVSGGAPALWPWQPILSELCGPEVAELLEGEKPSLTIEPDRFVRFVAVTDQLAATCDRSPACVIIDDVHAADPSALLLLRFIARSLARLGLALVIARRPHGSSGANGTGLLDEIEREGTPIALRPFGLSEATELLAAHGLGDLDPVLLPVLLRVTGGNPLFLRRIAALGAPGSAHAMPAGLRAAIDEALGRLGTGARQTLQASAVLGLAPSVIEAAAVADIPVPGVLEALDEAAVAGLVNREGTDRFSFSHELVRAAAEEAMATRDRLDAHARAANIVAADEATVPTDQLARRAHHALKAAPRSSRDGQQAVAACRAAASSMISSFAYEPADTLLSRTTELHDSPSLGPPPAPLLVEWAQAALLCGRLTDARMRFDRAASVADRDGDPTTFAEAALGLGGVWVNEHRSPTERARVLGLQRAALARLPVGERALRCRLRTRLAAEAVYDGGPIDDVRAALGQARRSGDARALAEALSLCHHAMLTPEHLPGRLELAEQLIDVAAQAGLGVLALMGLCWRAADLFHLADPQAPRALEDLRERADALACKSVLYIVEVLDVMVLIRSGRLDEAVAKAARAYELGTAVGDIDAFGYFGGQIAAVKWIQGRDTELLDLLEQAASSPTLIQPEFAFRATAAHVAARAGQVEHARASLDQLTANGLGALPRSSTWLTGMAALVEVAALLGDPQIAREAYELLEPFAHLPILASVGILCLGSTERFLGLAAMQFGDRDRALGHLERAVAANRRLPNRPLTAIARADLAEVLRHRGQPGDHQRAAQLIDEAVIDADDMGMAARADEWRATRAQLHEEGHRALPAGTVSRQGKGWLVALGDNRALVGNLVGMRYLAELLSHPGQHIAALTLASQGNGFDGSATQEVVDSTSRAAYAKRARELSEELAEAEDDANLGQAERLRIEMDALVEEIERSTGLAGRSRSFTGPTERARTAVRKAIKRAIDEIEAADHCIGELLRATVTTGTTCSYTPDRHAPERWRVRMRAEE